MKIVRLLLAAVSINGLISVVRIFDTFESHLLIRYKLAKKIKGEL